MTIEIHEPALEAVIREKTAEGGFATEEAMLMRAFGVSGTSSKTGGFSGADLIRVMQASPFREVDLEPERFVVPVREPEF